MDIRKSGLLCRLFRSRLFWSVIIIVSVWVLGYRHEIYRLPSNSDPFFLRVKFPLRLAATIIFGIFFTCALRSPRNVCPSIRESDVGYYLLFLLLTCCLVFSFVANTISLSILLKILLLAGSYLGTIFTLVEYDPDKNPHSTVPAIGAAIFCTLSIIEGAFSSNTACLKAIADSSVAALFFGAPVWYLFHHPATQENQDIPIQKDVEMKNERGEEITWAGHANVTPGEQEE